MGRRYAEFLPLPLLLLGLACGGLVPTTPTSTPEGEDEEPLAIEHLATEAEPGPPPPGALGRVALLDEDAGHCRLAVHQVGVGDEGTETTVVRSVAALDAPCPDNAWWSADPTLSRGWIWSETDLDGAWRFDGAKVERVAWPGGATCRPQAWLHADDGTPILLASFCGSFAELGVHPDPPPPTDGPEDEEVGAASAFRYVGGKWVAGHGRGLSYGPVESTEACHLPEAAVHGFLAWPGCGGGWTGVGGPVPLEAPPAFDWLDRCGSLTWVGYALPGGTLAVATDPDTHEALELSAFRAPGGPWRELQRCRQNAVAGAAWSGGGELVASDTSLGGSRVWWVRPDRVTPLWTPKGAQAVLWIGPPE